MSHLKHFSLGVIKDELERQVKFLNLMIILRYSQMIRYDTGLVDVDLQDN